MSIMVTNTLANCLPIEKYKDKHLSYVIYGHKEKLLYKACYILSSQERENIKFYNGFFHFFSDLLWTLTRYKMLSTYVDIFPWRIPVYAFTCIYPLLYQDCIVVRKSVKTSFFFLLSVIWTTIRCTAQCIFVSDVFEYSFEENCLWLIILFNIDSFCKCL